MKLLSRKTFALIIMLLVLTLALAACRDTTENGDTNDNGGAGGTEANGYVTPPEPPGPANGYVTPPVEQPTIRGIHEPRDLGGGTIVVASGWGNAMPFSIPSRMEEPDPAVTADYHRQRLIWDNAVRVEEEFNFVLDYVHVVDDYMGVFTSSVMAGSPVGDLVFLGGSELLVSVLGDLIMPLSAVNLPGSDIMGPQIYGRVNQSAFGEDWVFYYTALSIHVWMMGVNLDLINAIGAPNPIDLYNAGQWNWENALNVMRMATRDTTGDGVFDQWGIAGQPGDIAMHFIASNDGPLVDDNFNYSFDHPNTLAALEFIETIFREGLWQYDPVQGFNPGDWGRNSFAFHEGNAALFNFIPWLHGDLSFEFGVVPFPSGPNNTTGASWMDGWGGGLSLPFGSDWAPEDLLMITEEYLAWPGDEIELILEGSFVTPRTIFSTEEDVQRWASIANRARSDIGRVVPEYYWVLGGFVTHFAHQTMSVMEAIEAYRPPQQELLDLFFR